jgi:hypothetical protein
MRNDDEVESSRDAPPLPATIVKSATSRRLRRLTKNDLPLVISIAAVLIALLTYIDQHDSDRASAAAAEQAYAARVGFWFVSPDKPGQLPEIDVDNAGVLPISNVRVLLTATGYPWVEPPGTELYWATVEEHTIPPCEIVTSPVEQIVLNHVRPLKGVSYKLTIQSLEFTDASGLTWARSVDGALAQASAGHSGSSETLSTPIPRKLDMTNAPGCS